jgi:7-cyano-7-deazaguanine synthase
MKKEIVVIHSGGMDSSLCLFLACEEFGARATCSLSFDYGQRHHGELEHAAHIAHHFGVDHQVLDISSLKPCWEGSALVDRTLKIDHAPGTIPNTFVVGRNGIFVHLAATWAAQHGANILSLGVMERADANSGYPDTSRHYMDLMQSICRLDLGRPDFEVRTPLVQLDKLETLELAASKNILSWLLENTISCYEGIPLEGCRKCPACLLRNAGIAQFRRKYPHVPLPY